MKIVKIKITKIYLLAIGLGFALAANLGGCSMIKTKATQDPPSVRQRQCSELQGQINLNTTDAANNGAEVTGGTNIADQAATMRLHDKYGCGQLEK
jgi:hypothetical protein